MFRRIRIAILLFILVIVALSTWTDSIYSTRWTAPMVVALYPINADGSAATAAFIADLAQEDFAPLEQFFAAEAVEYDIKVDRPLRFTVAPPLLATPPPPPRDGNALMVIMWSLHFRAWAWWTPPKPPGPTPRVRLFLSYFDPARTQVLDHSTALKKGLVGVAQLFADKRMTGSNHTVIAHELLHTVGATDKYELGSNLPRYPDGFAEPERKPRYPQQFAEIMAGRIPLAAKEAKIPESLDQVLIGPATAGEIGWTK